MAPVNFLNAFSRLYSSLGSAGLERLGTSGRETQRGGRCWNAARTCVRFRAGLPKRAADAEVGDLRESNCDGETRLDT